MKIDVATPEEIASVAMHMRESDFLEFSALSHAETRADLAANLMERYAGREDVLCARSGREAIAIGAVIEGRPNVITLLFFATNSLPKIGKELTRFIRQRLFPPMIEGGVHRIECVSSAGHFTAHLWIKALGLEWEADCPGYGKGGEDYIQFAWVKKNAGTLSS